MTLKQLEALVKQGESTSLEFKKTTANLSAAMETVCAFLNSDRGGIVLIGVKDDGTILGQDVTDRNLQDLATEIKRIEPLTKINVQYITLDTGKKVIVLSIDPGLRAPYTYDGRPFNRTQSTTSRMSREQYEYLFYKNNPHRWEILTNNSCKINDLDKVRIKEIVQMGIDHGRITPAAMKSSIPDMLKKLELMVDAKLTNAAVILFGKAEKQLIQSNLKLARFNGIDKTSFYDNKVVRANAFDLYDRAMDFLHFNLPVAAYIKPGRSNRVETPAIPYNVLREAVTNALVHRDYSHAGGSMSIARYDDRLTITNIGSLPEGVSINKLGKEHESILRNPLIAKVFFLSGKIESWGRGTIDMIKDCKSVGNPLPIYEEIGNSFSVTLPLRESTITPSTTQQEHERRFIPRLTDRQNKILELLTSAPLTLQQITKKIKETLTDRTIQRELTNLKNMGLVEFSGKTKGAVWKIITT